LKAGSNTGLPRYNPEKITGDGTGPYGWDAGGGTGLYSQKAYIADSGTGLYGWQAGSSTEPYNIRSVKKADVGGSRRLPRRIEVNNYRYEQTTGGSFGLPGKKTDAGGSRKFSRRINDINS
jgi:hypothetical protein